MKIMLDNSEARVIEREEKYNQSFWRLRTPITGHRLCHRPYGLDNGCFSEFKIKPWLRMLDEARENKPVFVCLPDIVGDARRTLELFWQFRDVTEGLPRALVLQDGIGDFDIPWRDIGAVFVGGSDEFKISAECVNACKTAKILGKWIHVGRINSARRLNNWFGFGDSLDGSGISRIDDRLEDVLAAIHKKELQGELL